VVVQDGAYPFGLGALCEVFAEPYHPDEDNPVFDFVVCTPRPGRVRGGAGSAAGIDAALHVLRTTHGGKAASDAARRLVLPAHRDGGQAQFIRRPMPACTAETLAPLLMWIGENLEQDLSVGALARRATMSERTFARRFLEETGATPHGWITTQRVLHAEALLEGSDLAVERIAQQVGFSSAGTLRQQFTKTRGISPQQYRRQFACT